MPRTLARLTVLLTLIAVALTALAAPAGAKGKKAKPAPRQPAVIGIADQHGETFSDPLFTALGVRHARLNLAWDALQYDWQVKQLDEWMQSAQANGVTPLVIFSQSRVPGRTRIVPTPAMLGDQFDALRARYPFLTEFAAWNEANHPGQPTYRQPGAVAAFYATLRARCPGCTILPASLLDNRQLVPWTKTLLKAIRRLRAPQPKVWGFHNYSDVNRLKDASTKALLKVVKGQVWITESGGVVRATSPTASKFPQGVPYAGRVTRYILGSMLKRNPGVTRVYFYEWKAQQQPVSWDSGMVDVTGAPRPSYNILKQYLTNARLAARR